MKQSSRKVEPSARKELESTEVSAPPRPLRVLHVAPSLASEDGGPSVSILNFCRAASRSGLLPHLAIVADKTSVRANAISEQAADAGATLSTFAPFALPFVRKRRWGLSLHLTCWLLRNVKRFDIVVLHGAWLWSSMSGLAAARLRGRPTVMIPHGSLAAFDVQLGPSRPKHAIKRVMKVIYRRFCSLFIFASERERHDTFPGWESGAVLVLAHPISQPSLPLRATARPKSGLRIGFLGRFHPTKNLAVVVEALSLLPASVTLVIAGDGSPQFKEQLVHQTAQLGVADRIKWLGFVKGDAKEAFFSEIDLLAMPSAYESFGLSAAEALGRGIPAVVSSEAGIADLVRKNACGVVCTPAPADFANEIRRLHEHPDLLLTLARTLREALPGELSFTAFLQGLLAAYNRVLPRDNRFNHVGPTSALGRVYSASDSNKQSH